MRCPHCDVTIPADALFCIYCGTKLQLPPEARQPTPDRPAATGQTIDLGRDAAAEGPAQPGPASRQRRQTPSRQRLSAPPPAPTLASAPPTTCRQHNSGWLWIGLGAMLLFFTPLGHRIAWGWPSLLLLFGILVFLKRSSQGRHQEASRGLLWVIGLAVLFATGTFWPGILLLAGFMCLVK